MKAVLCWIVPSVFSILAMVFPAPPPESQPPLLRNEQPLPENLPTEPPTKFDKSDPLFQELLKQIEKNGPFLKDPSNHLPPADGDRNHHPKGLLEDAANLPFGENRTSVERRWFTIENLLRQARELKENATALRHAGLNEQSDRLEKIIQELRQIALESAPAS
ncbi:MAG: hypothetical protein RLY14_2081 [Planctomycetota bacterium]|jgi:hypothetical protein